MQSSHVLALDLEGTLISNAVSQIPRPGLHRFLVSASELFTRIVMFTTVEEPLFRSIATLLSEEGSAPSWFADVEYVRWQGATKDLSFVLGAAVCNVLLVDDFKGYVHPGQHAQWVAVEQFSHPYSSSDDALDRLLPILASWPGINRLSEGELCEPPSRADVEGSLAAPWAHGRTGRHDL